VKEELLPNEYYVVRLRYSYQGSEQFGGGNTTGASWAVPLDLIDKIDGPDYRFEWWVFVERKDGENKYVPISPNSETRSFIWKP
jgi:hypothetical protein